MRFDPHRWSGVRLDKFIAKIDKIEKDGLKTSPGNLWSIRKFLILDYCIDGFVQIFRKRFGRWYYIDTHCGTGLIGFEELRDERFPGSPLVAVLRPQDRRFSGYFFSDSDQDSIDALKKRLEALGSELADCRYELVVRDFAETIEFVKQLKGWDGFFIAIDPACFADVKWELMRSLLEIKTADIFFVFMTGAITRHRSRIRDISYKRSLVQFYGNEECLSCETGDLMKLYKQQMEQYRRYVFDIPVCGTGRQILYHIIIATNIKGARSVVGFARKIAKIKTETARGVLKVVIGENESLEKWQR